MWQRKILVGVLICVAIIEVSSKCRTFPGEAPIWVDSLTEDSAGNMTIPFVYYTSKLIVPNKYKNLGKVEQLTCINEHKHDVRTKAGVCKEVSEWAIMDKIQSSFNLTVKVPIVMLSRRGPRSMDIELNLNNATRIKKILSVWNETKRYVRKNATKTCRFYANIIFSEEFVAELRKDLTQDTKYTCANKSKTILWKDGENLKYTVWGTYRQRVLCDSPPIPAAKSC